MGWGERAQQSCWCVHSEMLDLLHWLLHLLTPCGSATAWGPGSTGKDLRSPWLAFLENSPALADPGLSPGRAGLGARQQLQSQVPPMLRHPGTPCWHLQGYCIVYSFTQWLWKGPFFTAAAEDSNSPTYLYFRLLYPTLKVKSWHFPQTVSFIGEAAPAGAHGSPTPAEYIASCPAGAGQSLAPAGVSRSCRRAGAE